MDVKTAFLNGELDEEIYVRPPRNENGQGQVVHLHKSLYGLKQASRSWNKRFDYAMKTLDFIPLKNDCCIYKSKTKGIILILYIDDILVIAKRIDDVSWIQEELGRLFKTKDLLEVKHFLGMNINRDVTCYICHNDLRVVSHFEVRFVGVMKN